MNRSTRPSTAIRYSGLRYRLPLPISDRGVVLKCLLPRRPQAGTAMADRRLKRKGTWGQNGTLPGIPPCRYRTIVASWPGKAPCRPRARATTSAKLYTSRPTRLVFPLAGSQMRCEPYGNTEISMATVVIKAMRLCKQGGWLYSCSLRVVDPPERRETSHPPLRTVAVRTTCDHSFHIMLLHPDATNGSFLRKGFDLQ